MGLFSRGPALAPLTPAPKVRDLPEARLQGAGRYLGTVTGEQRARARGLGSASAVRIQLSGEGVDVIRLPGSFRIEADALRSARTVREFDRSSVRDEGALVIRWQHGALLLDTGFSLDRGEGPAAATHRTWARTISKMANGTTKRSQA